jgi:PBP1b-binding outer membrane lipoprotein LpoB
MKALSLAILLTALLMAGCAGVETEPSSANTREQILCEQSRGAGVWVAAAGACIRGGSGA